MRTQGVPNFADPTISASSTRLIMQNPPDGPDRSRLPRLSIRLSRVRQVPPGAADAGGPRCWQIPPTGVGARAHAVSRLTRTHPTPLPSPQLRRRVRRRLDCGPLPPQTMHGSAVGDSDEPNHAPSSRTRNPGSPRVPGSTSNDKAPSRRHAPNVRADPRSGSPKVSTARIQSTS
jgi:hypothetical protein